MFIQTRGWIPKNKIGVLDWILKKKSNKSKPKKNPKIQNPNPQSVFVEF
jgi:hypothetical protein